MRENASASRRTAVRLLALGATVVGAAALTVPAATASPATQAAPHGLTAAIASHESHALHGAAHHGSGSNAVYSGNWSGYAPTGGANAFKSVSSSWVQPAVTCTSTNTYSSFWVGLDGYNNSALEQTGTEADCISGRAVYGAWWEVLPASESAYSVTVKPGDSMTASVQDNGNGTFTMTLTDSTQGWTKSTTHAGSSGYNDSSAEVIAEATSVNGRIAKLSNFGSVHFTGSKANGSTLPSSSTEIIMEGKSGDILAQPGSLSSGAFTDTWKNYS
jgi:Peptidase A4 family